MSRQAIEDYLDGLDPARRAEMQTLRATINRHLPKGYAETFAWGAIAWEVPLARYPDTYNGKPLLYAALASRKAGISVSLCGLNCGAETLREQLAASFAAAGLSFDMGAACLRLKSLDRVDLAGIGSAVAALDVDEFIAAHEAAYPPKAGARKKAKQSDGA